MTASSTTTKRTKTESLQPQAIIYCRVSSTKQSTQGGGLGSQETRCREYARYKGHAVTKVFSDDMSGSMISRPGMQAMLSFLRKSKAKSKIVIIDDVSRLARGLDAHLQLRAAIADAGATLESPSIEFGEDSDSTLVENLLASVSQHQRQKNAEQTVNRMRARCLNGYWCFQAPVGYQFKRITGQGNMLVRDEPIASIITEALEGFAAGRFETQVEVKRFLESQPAYPKDLPNGEIRNARIADLLARVIYAGHLEVPNWDVSLRKAQHEALISFATWQKIQDRLKSGAKAPARKDISADFPLRGFVLCGDCGGPLTACWSQSRTKKKHPYYMCPHKGCTSYRKSIRRADLEGAFEEELQKLQPTQTLVKLARAMFEDAWTLRFAQAEKAASTLQTQIQTIEKQIEGLLDRIVDSSNGSVIGAYESRIEKLEREKATLIEQTADIARPRYTFQELFEPAMAFLSSPWNIWKNYGLEWKRTVLRLAFCEQITYCREEGLRTAKTTLPFKRLADICSPKMEMARPAGFEPATVGLEGRWSEL